MIKPEEEWAKEGVPNTLESAPILAQESELEGRHRWQLMTMRNWNGSLPEAGVVVLGALAAFLGGWTTEAGERLPDLVLESNGGKAVFFNAGERMLGEKDRQGGNRWNAWFSGALGDVNGDGRLDNVSNEGVVLGNGDGHFGVLTTAFDPPCGDNFATGDLNGDGRADVVAATGRIHVLRGNPDGTLELVSDLGFELHEVTRLALVDMDGDEDLDLLAATRTTTKLLAYNQGNFAFQRYEGNVNYSELSVLGDLNADGLMDLVNVGDCLWEPGEIRKWAAVNVTLGSRPDGFAPPAVICMPGWDPSGEERPVRVAVADMNDDGSLDLVVSGKPWSLNTFPGKGDGTLGDPFPLAFPEQEAPTAILLQDLDLDGHLDLVAAFRQQTTKVYWGSKGGLPDLSMSTHLSWGGAMRIEAYQGIHRPFIRGDANDDGGLDLGDAVTILEQLFRGREMVCGDASDADDSGWLDLLDPVYLLQHLIRHGPAPSAPFPLPGTDPTIDTGGWEQGSADDLGCSFETFHPDEFRPCLPDDSPDECPHPPLERLQLCPAE